MYDGDSPHGPLLASLSGSTRPPPIEASSGKVGGAWLRGRGWRNQAKCIGHGGRHTEGNTEGTRHPSEGYRGKERWRETKTGDGAPQGGGCRSIPPSMPPQSLIPHACRCCCTSSVMPTTTCWASTPPSASLCALAAAAATDSASLRGCVSASQAGGAPTAACRSAQPTAAATAPAPR